MIRKGSSGPPAWT